MINDIETRVDQYLLWLKDRTKLRQIADIIEITTPYLDRHNDYLQIYAQRHNGGYILTDDGYILNDLILSGCNLESPKRQDLLHITLNGFGIQLNKEALEVRANNENFALKKHNLIQAMLAVNDLFYLSVPMITSLFMEDVTNWLDAFNIRYLPRVKLTGKSGYDHVFDFAIPKSNKSPERIVQAINAPKKDSVSAFAWAWIDTRDERSQDACAYALLNDSEHDISSAVLDALRNYDVKPILWSDRDSVKDELVA